MTNERKSSLQEEMLPRDIEILDPDAIMKDVYTSARRSFLKLFLGAIGVGGVVGAFGYQQWRIHQLEERISSHDRVQATSPEH